MTDEQLRILCATILCAVSYAGEADCVSISETTAAEWADRLIAAARASSPPAPAAQTLDPLNDDHWCAYCGEASIAHTDSPDCQCADCLKRDARRWRMARRGWWIGDDATVHIDSSIAAATAKEQAK